jgi:exosortase E/protease (VPEID-CTERM system)
MPSSHIQRQERCWHKAMRKSQHASMCRNLIAAQFHFLSACNRVVRNFIAKRRVFFLLLVIVAQAVFLKFTLHPQANTYTGNYALLGRAAQPIVFYFITGFLVLASTRLPVIWQTLIACSKGHCWRRLIFPQWICYFLIIYSASKLMPTDFPILAPIDPLNETWWVALLLTTVAMTFILSLTMIAPKSYWFDLLKNEKASLLLASGFSVAAFGFSILFQQSWDLLGEPTMIVSKMLLDLVYDNIYMDLQARVLGASYFSVIIDRQCSGYEGIGLIIAFLTWYLMNFKRDYRFPAALLLFPIGIVSIWLLNAVRIALLISIGLSVSPEISVKGFHSNAGIISFVLVALSLVWGVRITAMFSESHVKPRIVINCFNAPVIPFLIMLSANLLCAAFSADFQWLYPLRALSTALAIIVLWKHFGLAPSIPHLVPVLGGILAFLVWIMLVRPSAEADKVFENILFSVPSTVSAGWLVIRFLGSAIIIPIAEELAFRGYLVSLLSSRAEIRPATGDMPWFPIIATSLMFGALHSSWMAATIAGCIYYLVKLYSGRLWDAVAAHMTTNFLLSLYVLISGHWSYW